ncbi:hypothetical protein HDK77DRAFT_311218 [Phyllosticta capitalensis]|uniref:uncharacterized protein n=1 Tax=Phyllosticta capitalensis TaxID=121624 RepID=UPI00312F5A20
MRPASDFVICTRQSVLFFSHDYPFLLFLFCACFAIKLNLWIRQGSLLVLTISFCFPFQFFFSPNEMIDGSTLFIGRRPVSVVDRSKTRPDCACLLSLRLLQNETDGREEDLTFDSPLRWNGTGTLCPA